ncbi:hypothetical protein PTI98_002451 [Pleurotus ostreatus]|nr:hypothetical protein PTI98_002451 [Pleurotus ostreatus]
MRGVEVEVGDPGVHSLVYDDHAEDMVVPCPTYEEEASDIRREFTTFTVVGERCLVAVLLAVVHEIDDTVDYLEEQSLVDA